MKAALSPPARDAFETNTSSPRLQTTAHYTLDTNIKLKHKTLQYQSLLYYQGHLPKCAGDFWTPMPPRYNFTIAVSQPVKHILRFKAVCFPSIAQISFPSPAIDTIHPSRRASLVTFSQVKQHATNSNLHHVGPANRQCNRHSPTRVSRFREAPKRGTGDSHS